MYNHTLTGSVFWNDKLNHMVRHRGKLSCSSAGWSELIKQTETFLKKAMLNPSYRCHCLKCENVRQEYLSKVFHSCLCSLFIICFSLCCDFKWNWRNIKFAAAEKGRSHQYTEWCTMWLETRVRTVQKRARQGKVRFSLPSKPYLQTNKLGSGPVPQLKNYTQVCFIGLRGSRNSESFWQGTRGKYCLEHSNFGQSKATFLLEGTDGWCRRRSLLQTLFWPHWSKIVFH